MKTDIAYAIRQLKLAQTYGRPSIILDCVQRAIDALERAAEQPDPAASVGRQSQADDSIAHHADCASN